MFSMEDKKSIVDDVFTKFYDIFGFYPESTGSYYILQEHDIDQLNYINMGTPKFLYHKSYHEVHFADVYQNRYDNGRIC